MSIVYVATTRGEPAPGDDARAVVVVPLAELGAIELAFDHRAIIDDYLRDISSRGLATLPLLKKAALVSPPIDRDTCVRDTQEPERLIESGRDF